MLKNRKLARVVSDARFGKIRRQLTYKTPWNGGHLEIADRWFPSPKRCSGCQAVKPNCRSGCVRSTAKRVVWSWIRYCRTRW